MPCAQSENGATWPQQTGQDFSTNFATPGIDFSEIHMWVDDWMEVRAQSRSYNPARVPPEAVPLYSAVPSKAMTACEAADARRIGRV